MQYDKTPNRILIFHIGHLGDTLMIFPTLRALQENFPKASFASLSDKMFGEGSVLGASLFNGLNFFNEIITFPKSRG
jgi:ADP-heptose:LPS heptosyltransferase